MIKDSGNRTEFSSGAVRDIQGGKGRCDLMPLCVLGDLFTDVILTGIGKFTQDPHANTSDLCAALNFFLAEYFVNSETALLEVAVHYEEGAKKYGEHNWEKGIPLHSFIDSAVRHYLKHKRGDTDERHDRAFIWNILGALWTIENRPDLNDL